MCLEYFYPLLLIIMSLDNYDLNEIDIINLTLYESSRIYNLLSWPED